VRFGQAQLAIQTCLDAAGAGRAAIFDVQEIGLEDGFDVASP
jgi:hypothetical protein